MFFIEYLREIETDWGSTYMGWIHETKFYASVSFKRMIYTVRTVDITFIQISDVIPPPSIEHSTI